MVVVTSRNFYDLKEDCYRKAGDRFEVSKARFDELNSKVPGFVSEAGGKKEEKEDSKASKK